MHLSIIEVIYKLNPLDKKEWMPDKRESISIVDIWIHLSIIMIVNDHNPLETKGFYAGSTGISIFSPNLEAFVPLKGF